MPKKAMEKQWFGLWRRISAFVDGVGSDGKAEYEALVTCYGEPHRAYHTLAHVEHCLAELDQMPSLLRHARNRIQLAIWYHYAVYDPRANDNEEKSAVLAESVLRDAGHPHYAPRVAELILATKHASPPDDNDSAARLLVDVDLSSLAAPWEEFLKNTENIRKEYTYGGAMTDAEFAAGRVRFFETFLQNRPSIFTTRFFREKYEAQAKDNLRKSIALLRGE